MRKRRVAIFLGLCFLGLVFFIINKNFIEHTNSDSSKQKLEVVTKEKKQLEIVAKNLDVPWALAFLPNGDLLFTERVGNIKLIKKDFSEPPILVAKIPDVLQSVESGLHGIAVHPNYPNEPYIFVYYTYQSESSGSPNNLNKVVRFKFYPAVTGDKAYQLSEETIMVDKIPGANFHDGGRIKFGPNKNLYITTGDATNPSLSQDLNSPAGKILKISKDHLEENAPVEIFSLGHRNPQGITWDNKENLWEAEHGSDAFDEINFIEKGKNYGWPEIRGYQEKENMEKPILHSGQDTWAPAGMAFFEGSLYFGGLRGQALYQYDIEKKELKTYLKGQLGRIRDVVLGPDNLLYITTSNRDGRGTPSSRDDKILRLDPITL
ncbi:PQQ-dependent sugar dehydrogenase [Candidatus Daviesbacteria bacterium]|nr:PQQ-dependent sugar dehydrogenase [Candidatus Daviesbacteria bacterium]